MQQHTISLFDPTGKIIECQKVGGTYQEAEMKAELLNQELPKRKKKKGYYWTVTAINS